MAHNKASPLLLAALLGMIICIAVREIITPSIQALYTDPTVFYAPAHFGDARQYVFICNEGYFVPPDAPTLVGSRLSWMPVYALLQCALHRVSGLSLVYTGITISTVAMGLTVLFAALILRNFSIPQPAFHALAVLIVPVGTMWLYLPGADATFLCIGMVALWLITLPTPPNNQLELGRVVSGLVAGSVLILTKPNALALLLPLSFAFLYRSWEKSRQAGYAFGLWSFTADMLIDHLRPILITLHILKQASSSERPVRYDWTALTIAAGISVGFAFWLAYSSILSGVPFYFLRQQLDFWGRSWETGNLRDMLTYFAQAFRTPDRSKPWNYDAAWALAAVVSALVPAASPRVPALLRGMLWLMIAFMVFTGTAHYATERYLVSTMLVSIGWACWLAGQKKRNTALRWSFMICLAVITSYLLVGQMMPLGEPKFWVILPDNRLLPW